MIDMLIVEGKAWTIVHQPTQYTNHRVNAHTYNTVLLHKTHNKYTQHIHTETFNAQYTFNDVLDALGTTTKVWGTLATYIHA